MHELRDTRVAGRRDQVLTLAQFAAEVVRAVAQLGHLHREHGPDAVDRLRQRVAVAQVAGDQLDAEGSGSCRVADQRPYREIGLFQSSDDSAALLAGGADDENGIGQVPPQK